MWRPEVNLGCLPQTFSTLFFEMKSLTFFFLFCFFVVYVILRVLAECVVHNFNPSTQVDICEIEPNLVYVVSRTGQLELQRDPVSKRGGKKKSKYVALAGLELR